jgi:hypothetical protein
MKNIFKYWLAITKKAWKTTRERLGVGGLIIDLFITIIVPVIYHLLISKDSIFIWWEIVLYLGVFIGLIMAAILFFIPIEAAMQDNEQKEVIAKLYKKELQLSLGVGDGEILENDELVLEFENFNDKEEIHNLYVHLFNITYWTAEWGKGHLEKNSEKAVNDYYIGRNLKWIRPTALKEYISLKPMESGHVLLVKDSYKPESLIFEYDKNRWDYPSTQDGIYVLRIELRGKVGNDDIYRKIAFDVEIGFRKFKEVEVIGSSYVPEPEVNLLDMLKKKIMCKV